MTGDQPRTVLLLCSDLMLTSSVGFAAASAGLRFVSTSRAADAVDFADSGHPLKLVIDFGLPGLDIADLAQQLPTSVRDDAVAFGPHVHTEKFATAREAGIGTVTSRGHFTSNLSHFLTGG